MAQQKGGSVKAPPAAKASPAATEGEGQSHPLYSQDRATVDRLLAAKAPADADLVDAARLLSRYDGFPGAFDLQNDLERAIRLWGFDRDTLQAKTRVLWQGGYKPGASDPKAEPVGSGFDASGEQAT